MNRAPMLPALIERTSMRSAFWTFVAAVVFGALKAVYWVGTFGRATLDTICLGKSAGKQLRGYEDDLNGRY